MLTKQTLYSIHIPFNFAKYKENDIFVDCDYSLNGQQYHAHKIVLSFYSSLFREYFASTNESHIPIPFGEDYFQDMIDFFYTRKVDLSDDKIDKLIQLYAMSVIYGVKTLETIVFSFIEKVLQQNEAEKPLTIVLSLTKAYKDIKLNQSEAANYKNIYNNFENLLRTQTNFINSITRLIAPKNEDAKFFFQELFESTRSYLAPVKISQNDDLNLFFRSVTPFLLSETLKQLKLSNEQNAKIIDACVKTMSNLSKKDKEDLQTVINWEDDKAYLLFATYDMKWVTDDVARDNLQKLINARSTSLDAFVERANNMEFDNISNWYTISNLELIRSSKNETELPNIDAPWFIGTFGNVSQIYYNPILFRFVDDRSSPCLGPDNFKQLFSSYTFLEPDPKDSTEYYVSSPNSNPQISISFLQNNFLVFSAKIYSVPQKPKYQNVELSINSEFIQSKTIPHSEDDNKGKNIHEDSNCVTFQLEEPKAANSISFSMRTTSPHIFRVKYIEIFGHFLPNVINAQP